MPVITPIKISTPSKRYPPVGHCIYCRTYSNHLSKEHVIPHGLAGDSLILPKASCRACQEKTRDWETRCLRHLWWPFRTRIGAPSSGKQPPKKFLLRTMKVTDQDRDGTIQYNPVAETEVEPSEFPLMFMAYKFPAPGVLCGRGLDDNLTIDIVAQISAEEVRKVAPNDKDGFRIAPMDIAGYCRMLAKIAHAYAVAELGHSAFRATLCEIIRGKEYETYDPYLQWIGGETNTPPSADRLHDIQWRIVSLNGINYVVVNLRLFSFMRSPQYNIIVGELTLPTDQLPFLEQPLYTIDVETTLPSGEMVPIN